MTEETKPDPTLPDPDRENVDLPKPSEQLNALLAVGSSLKDEIAVLEDKLKAKKKQLTTIVKAEIPNLLSGLQTSVWEHDGVSTKMATKFSGSLSKAPDEEKAVEHLRDNDFVGALKTVLQVEFSEDEREKAELLAGGISSSYDREVSYERTINAATLKAWANAKLKDGVPIDLDVLGLSTWREATITKSKD